MRVSVVLVLGILGGCLQATDDFSSGGGPSGLGAMANSKADGGPGSTGNPAGPTQYDWRGDVGPSSPDLFVSASGWKQVGTCPGSACVDFFSFDPSCVFGLQVDNAKTTAVLSSADCAAFKNWLMSDVLLAGLRDSCGGKTGEEELSVEAATAARTARKKFDSCGEPFTSHRAALAAIRATYFPGK